jgi:hypothetical protein
MIEDIELQDLPTLATNDIPFDSILPIAFRESNVTPFEMYKITLKQLEVRLFHIKVEDVWNAFEKDSNLTNIIFELRNNLIVLNYNETNLNALTELVENTILPQLIQVIAVLTDDDGNLVDVARELQILRDQISAILNQQNFVNSTIFSVPDRIDPTIQYYNISNYSTTNTEYNFYIDKFQNLIYLNIYVSDEEDMAVNSIINIFNAKSIFADLTSDSILEIKIIFWTKNDLAFLPTRFLEQRKIKFYSESIVTTRPLFQFSLFDNIKPISIPLTQFSFSCFFNKEGFVKHDSPDQINFASQQDLQNISSILAQELLANFSAQIEIKDDTFIVYFRTATINNYFSIQSSPPNINKILIYIIQQKTLIPVENFYFHFPFHELKTDTVEVVLEFDGREEKGQAIIQNSKQPQWMQASYAEETNTLEVFSLLQELLPIKTIDLFIQFGKENTPEDFTAVVDQHCEQLNVNIKLEQPFLQQNEFLPQFFKPAVLPNQSENLIAFRIDSLVGKLDSLQFIEVVLNLGDCDGFFRNLAFFFTEDAVPTNFDYNASQLFNQIVPVGINNKIDGVTTTLATRSFYRFQIKKENDICFATLLEVNSANDISLEKNRLIQWQELFQAYSTQMFDMLVYFPQAIVSNRGDVNFDNMAFPNPEYCLSTVSALVPPRETEYKFVGALLINPKTDKYQNNKLATNSNSLVVIQKFHIVDWNCDSEAFVEKTDDERTIFIVLEDFITAKTLYFNLDLTFGSRFGNVGDSQKFYIKIINNKQNIIINDQSPNFNQTYGLQLDNPNILYTKEFEIVRRAGKPPLAQQLDKGTLQFAFATSPTINAEIPYNAPIIKSIDPDKYWTITEVENYVQQEIVNITTGGAVDLSGYATKLFVDQEINTLAQTFVDTFATKNDLNNYVQSTTIFPINNNIANLQTGLTTAQGNITTINTNLINIQSNIERIQPKVILPSIGAAGSLMVYLEPNVVGKITYVWSNAGSTIPITCYYNSDNLNNDKILSAEIFITCAYEINSLKVSFFDRTTSTIPKTITININGASNAKKYLVRMTCDYTTTVDSLKYFAEAIATDFDSTILNTKIDTNNTNTLMLIDTTRQDILNEFSNTLVNYYTADQIDVLINQPFVNIIDDLNNGYYLKASHIVNLVDKFYPTESRLDYGSDNNTIVVVNNKKISFLGRVYADWDIDVTSLGAVMVANYNNAIGFSSPPDHTFTLTENYDTELLDCTFAAVRWFDFYSASSSAGGTINGSTGSSTFANQFRMIIDGSLLGDDFVKFSWNNMTIRVAGTRYSATNFPNANPVAPSSAIYNHHNALCLFSILYKNQDGTLFNVATFPYTLVSTTGSSSSLNVINGEILVNNSQWRYGNYYDGDLLKDSGNQNYITLPTTSVKATSGSASANQVRTLDVSNDWDECLVLIPIMRTFREPNVNSILNNVVDDIDIILNTNIITDFTIRCQLRFYISGLKVGAKISIYHNSLSNKKFTITITKDINSISVFDYEDVVMSASTLTYAIKYDIKDVNYYDWNYTGSLTIFNQTKVAYTAVQYNSLLPYSGRLFTIPSGNDQATFTNLKFYHIRSSLEAYSSTSASATFYYTTTGYSLSNKPINITTTSNDWVQIIVKNWTLYRGCPMASSYVFPLTTGTTTSFRVTKQAGDTMYVQLEGYSIWKMDAYSSTYQTTSLGKLQLLVLKYKNKTIWIRNSALPDVVPSLYRELFATAYVCATDNIKPSNEKVILKSKVNLTIAQGNLPNFVSFLSNVTIMTAPLAKDEPSKLALDVVLSNGSDLIFNFDTTNEKQQLLDLQISFARPSDGVIKNAIYRGFNYKNSLVKFIVNKKTYDLSVPVSCQNNFFHKGYILEEDKDMNVIFGYCTYYPSSITTTPQAMFDYLNGKLIYLLDPTVSSNTTPEIFFRLFSTDISESSPTIICNVRRLTARTRNVLLTDSVEYTIAVRTQFGNQYISQNFESTEFDWNRIYKLSFIPTKNAQNQWYYYIKTE